MSLKNFIIIFFVLLFVGLIIYSNCFFNKFLWDDNDFIVNNAYIKSFRFIPQYFSQNLIAGAGKISNYWRPFLLLSFALDYKIWKLNPFGYHLTNVLLHIADAFLVFYLLYFLFKNKTISLFSSLLFLVHPLQTEAVTYISGRGDSLAFFFILLALIFYCFSGRKGNRYLIFSLIFYIFALFSKGNALIFPFLAFLCEWLLDFQDKKNFWNRFLPTLIISLIYLILRFSILDFGGPVLNVPLISRLLTFSKAILIYLGLIFVPIHLHMERNIGVIKSFNLEVLFSILVVSFLVFLIVYFWKKKNKIIPFGLLWFFAALLPYSNIIPINAFLYEHWLYIPLVGAGIVLAYIFNYIFQKNKWLAVFLFIPWFIFLSAQSFARNFDWKNPVIFYSRTLKYTKSIRLYNNYAMALADEGKYLEAVKFYKKALALGDFYPQVHNNLGNSYKSLGKFDLAVREFKKAIAMDKYFLIAYNNLASVYILEKKYLSAINVYKKYLEFNPPNKFVLEKIKEIENLYASSH